jgi:hypothetical protein
MAGSSRDIQLGARWVYYGTAGGAVGEEVDLGYTKGGVTVTIETGSYEVLVDQEGDSPVREALTGRRVTVVVPMAETNYQRLQKLIPDSTYNAATGELDVMSGIGEDLMDFADQLKLVAKDDPTDIIYIPYAAPVANLQATFLPNAEVIWPVQFKSYVPPTGHTYAGILARFVQPS